MHERLNKVIGKIGNPCNTCPYKLGLIRTVENPCPQCRLSNYRNYSLFKEQLSKEEKM